MKRLILNPTRALSNDASPAIPQEQTVAVSVRRNGHLQSKLRCTYFIIAILFIIRTGIGTGRFAVHRELSGGVSKGKKDSIVVECPDLPALGESQNIVYPPKHQRPTGLHLAFVGDSVTRFQVLCLMHYLHTGTWIDPNVQVGNMADPSAFRDWPHFFSYASSYFGDAVRCDCFRKEFNVSVIYDNWYYRDDCRNNTLYHFTKFGSSKMHGHWSSGDVSSWSVQPFNSTRDPELPLWEGDVTLAIRQHISLLSPKPDYIIFNQGLWPDHDLLSHDDFEAIVTALNETGIKGIWKTTTKSSKEQSLTLRPHDEIACSVFEYCLDLSWTGTLNQSEYLDNVHFRSDIYTVFNQQLLEMLRLEGYPILSVPVGQ